MYEIRESATTDISVYHNLYQWWWARLENLAGRIWSTDPSLPLNFI